MTRRFHWFAYYAPPWEMKEPYRKNEFDVTRILHQTRDGMAFAELSHALSTIGYEYSGPVLNLPVDLYQHPKSSEQTSVRRGDLIVQVTRPQLIKERSELIDECSAAALGDPQPKPRSRGEIPRSDIELESALTTSLKTYLLSHCSRNKIDLNSDLANTLPNDLRRYAGVDFRTNNSACYDESWCKEHKLSNAFLKRTAGYLAFVPNLAMPYVGVSALLVWGQSGFESLFMNWILHHRFSSIISQVVGERKKQIQLLMAEWSIPSMPPRPTSLREFSKAAKNTRLLFHASRKGASSRAWHIDTLKDQDKL